MGDDWDDFGGTTAVAQHNPADKGHALMGRGRGMSFLTQGVGGLSVNSGGDDGWNDDPTPSSGGFYNNSSRDEDGGRGHGGRGSRGGGRGGRGGQRRFDEDGGGGGFRRNNDKEGGGGGFRRRNDEEGGGGGGFRRRNNDEEGGGGGGFRRRNNDEEGGGGGGFRKRNDEEGGGGGGFRKRNDEEGGGGGGFRRRNNDEEGGGGGGFRRRNNDEEGGGGGGGFRRRNNDEEGGGSGGGFRKRNNDEDGGGGGFRRREDGGGNEEGDEKPKERYIPPAPTEDESEIYGSGISSGINFDNYDSIPVKVTGDNIPPPINTFEAANLRQFVMDNVLKSGYLKPTPIQKHSLPIVMSGRDLMACAQTGSGKTAAFLVPMINAMLEDQRDLVRSGEHTEPHAVIVAPTRELAIQIHAEARKFARGSIVQTRLVYGGTVTGHQIRQLMEGCHILVATPGRLNDFVNRGLVQFGSIRFVVLDEADRMLDMGFLPDIEKVMSHTTMVPTGERQTLMFSATFPSEIQQLAGKFLHNYLFVSVGNVGEACTNVQQIVLQVPKFEKRKTLKNILSEHPDEKTLVFVETKRTADFIASFLSEQNVPTTSIHGDRLQREREEALFDFKKGTRNVLVATAVAARGLDIKNVAHVVNYDLPKAIDEYVHRIGRTGRVGNRGKATSFYDPENDAALAGDLVRILSQAGQPVEDFLQNAGGGGGSGYRGGGRFGGRDIRKFEDEGSSAPASHVEPEEEW
ncbi:ATP-dependent RNA helicase vasa-like [Bacillus rossius redtenbacheri]|uniref:ATP-dependent RNA helicase vasa-like n=1 Tax=Bacillus rossius redtenbacheri TaxID=93214 RepID=UPI002FDDC1C0